MEAPKSWFILGESIHQDVLLICGDIESGVRMVLHSMTSIEREQLARYLVYLIESPLGLDEKMEAWLSSGAEWWPMTSQIEQFLGGILRLIREIS